MSSIPATFLEREFDFWTAYLMSVAALVVSVAALVLMKSKFGQFHLTVAFVLRQTH